MKKMRLKKMFFIFAVLMVLCASAALADKKYAVRDYGNNPSNDYASPELSSFIFTLAKNGNSVNAGELTLVKPSDSNSAKFLNSLVSGEKLSSLSITISDGTWTSPDEFSPRESNRGKIGYGFQDLTVTSFEPFIDNDSGWAMEKIKLDYSYVLFTLYHTGTPVSASYNKPGYTPRSLGR